MLIEGALINIQLKKMLNLMALNFNYKLKSVFKY